LYIQGEQVVIMNIHPS